MRRTWFACSTLALTLALPGCVADGTGDKPDDVIDPDPNGDDPLFQSCRDGAAPTDLPTVDWNHTTSAILSAGHAWHSSQDVLAPSDGVALIAGKFSYTDISKDLEDERIEVWLDDCNGGYTNLGERITDSDGRIELALSGDDLPLVGEYGLYLRVMGDNTAARSVLRVYPPETRFIVFDIDATLTTSDTELVGQIILEIIADGTTPDARESAVDITQLRHGDHGYELVYLTGRPYLLDELTRSWLTDLGFADGTVHLTDSVSLAWPSESQVGTFKADFLQRMLDQGFVVHAAYGNATTDIYAYDRVGIARERTFILGDNGGQSGTVALGEGYTEHIGEIAGEAPAEQPFHR